MLKRIMFFQQKATKPNHLKQHYADHCLYTRHFRLFSYFLGSIMSVIASGMLDLYQS